MPRGLPGQPQDLGQVEAKFYGTTGLCLIPEGLRYIDSNRVWVVPFFHAFYYGVLKRLFELTFPIPGADAHTPYPEVSVQLPDHPEYVNPVMVNFPADMKPDLAARKHIASTFARIVSGVLSHLV